MTAAKFESSVLKSVASLLEFGGDAKFFNGSLFVSGIVPGEAKMVLRELRDQYGRVRMSRTGSYQTDYTFAYDFVA